jgi:polymorphic membrane protein
MRTAVKLLTLFLVGGVFQLAHAKTIVVHSLADDGPGSLRQAIASAAGGDKINIVVNGTIVLTSGELLVDKGIIIKGPGAHGIISGNNTSRVFYITRGATVTLDSLTITNGAASNDPNAAYPLNAGGGIFSDHASVTLANCTVRNNSALLGGGVFSSSKDGGNVSLIINNSTIINNFAHSLSGFDFSAGGAVFSGGGFFNTGPAGNAQVIVRNSVFSGNSAEYLGGAIFNDGFAGSATLSITNSTLSRNVAKNLNGFGIGGAVYNNGDSGIAVVTITHSDLIGNSAGGSSIYGIFDSFGGALYNDGGSSITPAHADIAIIESSFRDNSALGAGGAIASFTFEGSTTTITLSSTLLSRNLASDSVVGDGGAIECANDRGSARLTIASCDLRGNSASNGGGIEIQNVELEMANSRVDGNSAPANDLPGHGGGILIDPSFFSAFGGGPSRVTLTNCTVSGNSSDASGGIANWGAALNLIGCTISNNSARFLGGGIFNQGSVMIDSSTISGNSSTTDLGKGKGGGIFNSGASTTATVTLINSTVTGNSADVGGGIYNHAFTQDFFPPGSGAVKLSNSTLSGNSATFAGGIFTWDSTNAELGTPIIRGIATVELANSIINAASAGENLVAYEGGKIITDGYNLSSDAAGGDATTAPGGLLNGPGDTRNTNPRLGPLQNNGGPTLTHALLKNSPAINAGNPNFNPYSLNPPLLYDQRGPGFPRIVKGRLDIGSFESQPH